MMLRFYILLLISFNSYSNQLIQYNEKSPLQYFFSISPKISSIIQLNAQAAYTFKNNLSLYSNIGIDFTRYTLVDSKTLNTCRMNDLYHSSLSLTNNKLGDFKQHKIYQNKKDQYTSAYINNMKQNYIKSIDNSEDLESKKNKNINDPIQLIKAKSKLLNFNRSYNILWSLGISKYKEFLNTNNKTYLSNLNLKLSCFTEVELMQSLFRPLMDKQRFTIFETINSDYQEKDIQQNNISKKNILYRMKDLIKIGGDIKFSLQLLDSLHLSTQIQLGITPIGFFYSYNHIRFPHLIINTIDENNYNQLKRNKNNKLIRLTYKAIDKTNKELLLNPHEQKNLLFIRNIFFINIKFGLETAFSK